jgi:hypothetical protein
MRFLETVWLSHNKTIGISFKQDNNEESREENIFKDYGALIGIVLISSYVSL